MIKNDRPAAVYGAFDRDCVAAPANRRDRLAARERGRSAFDCSGARARLFLKFIVKLER